VESIPAIVWFSDLRKSTALAAQMSAEQYLDVLNVYFESTAGAVLDHGREVLSFIGDGVPVLVSSAFAKTLALQWKHLGLFEASGVEGGLQVFEPPPEVLYPSA
jgi:class 3 adenylate cyclase